MSMPDKFFLRREMLAKRQELPPDHALTLSERICSQVMDLLPFKKSENLLIYASYNHEVDTFKLIQDALGIGKHVALPRVLNKTEMAFFEIHSLKDLKQGYMGILEPNMDCTTILDSGFMVMPGVAFDIGCHRIGYGGGFYDRYLSSHKSLPTCAIAFDFQILDQVPVDTYDVFPDMIITEKRIIMPY